MRIKAKDTAIPTLGEAKIPSPLLMETVEGFEYKFISDKDRILVDLMMKDVQKTIDSGDEPPSFEVAGPRDKVYFDPSKLKCGIVTCGGICPGLNDIIRSVVLELYHRYGVKNIYGIRYGLEGFIPEYGHDIIDLDPSKVANILDMGGTILGSSRGAQDIDAVIDCLERMNIGIVFMIGGDGTLIAANRISEAIKKRGLKISIITIPKTIDNDIHLVSRSFGFDTAVQTATSAIKSAHNEAKGYYNGIGLIKLMGRHSGFLAATAALAQQDVNFVLIPEVDTDLWGDKGFLAALEARLERSKHAVIIVAEGFGQHLFEGEEKETDPSGNIKLKDIGLYVKDEITRYFHEKDKKITLKYIDPSYIMRSLSANSNDSVFCGFLGRDAVHAGMAGKTQLMVSNWNNHFVHIPMKLSAGKRKQVSPTGKLWHSVIEATGQPLMKNKS